jgi:hypothetical protein
MAPRVKLRHRNGYHVSEHVFSLKALAQRSWLRPFRQFGAPWERYYPDDAKEVTNLPASSKSAVLQFELQVQAVGSMRLH